MINHIPTCHILEDTVCTANISLYGEPSNTHFWSGFPGAICIKCHQEDKRELCLADNCLCQCHNWPE